MFETIVRGLNGGGEWFCGWAWAMLWQSSVLIAVLVAADMLLRRRVRATVRYALWMLVLIKLVLPPSLCMPTGVGYWCNINLPAETAVQEIRNPKFEIRNKPEVSNAGNAQNEESVRRPSDSSTTAGGKWSQTPEEKGSDPISPAPAAAVTWQGMVFLAWLAGVLVLVLLMLQRVAFVRSLIAQSKPAEGRLREMMDVCKAQAGVRGQVELRLTENMLSPAACGLWRPVVLMPRPLLESLSRERVRAVLIHELVHVRRMDLWANLVQTVLQMAYFYNPLLWLANARIRAVREQAVDEAALANLGDEAGEYGKTLVAVAEVAFGQPHLSLRLVGVVESKKSLASRIRHIAQMGIPKNAKIGLAGMTAVILAAFVLLPMASAKDHPAEFVIKGKVTDAATGKPIAGARVGDDGYAGGKQWTTTDANGNYSYLTWYEEHGVAAQADGYRKQGKGFGTKIFGSEKEKVLNFALEPGAGDIDLAAVTVQEGVGFGGFIVGDTRCTGEAIKAKLGKPDEEVRDEKGWWLDYRKSRCIDFWIDARTNTLHEIRLDPGFKGKLASGISMSSDMKEVFSAYGKPVREEASDHLSKSGFDDQVLYRGPVSDFDQALYRIGISAGSGVSKIYYQQKGLLIWFEGKNINQLVIFPAKQKADAENTKGSAGELSKTWFVGRWKGQAKMVVDFVADSNLPVDITIDANGVVTGTVGDAMVKNARMKEKGVVELEWLKQKRRYIIQGALVGDFIAREGLRRSKFTMGLDFEDGRIVGSVGTSGGFFGGKKDAMIIAHNMVLETDNEGEVTIDTTLFLVDVNDGRIGDVLKETLKAGGVTTQGPLFTQVELTEDQAMEFIKRMHAVSGAKTLAAPKVKVRDGEKAEISVRKTEPAGTGATAAQGEYVTTGIALSLTPHLQEDGSTVLLEVVFEKTDRILKKDETGKESPLPAVNTESVSTKVYMATGKRILFPIAGSSQRQTILLVKASAN